MVDIYIHYVDQLHNVFCTFQIYYRIFVDEEDTILALSILFFDKYFIILVLENFWFLIFNILIQLLDLDTLLFFKISKFKFSLNSFCKNYKFFFLLIYIF